MTDRTVTATDLLYLTCRDQVDPLLYGEEPKSARDEDDYDDVIEALRCKLEELQVFKESYEALNVRLRVRERERERERDREREKERQRDGETQSCLLYTSDAADES